MIAVVVVMTAAVATKPAGWFTGGFPAAAARAAAASAGDHGKVFVMSPYADWLLWSRPELRGRIAFDARFELLTSHQLSTIGAFQGRVGDWTKAVRRYKVIVLGSRDDANLRDALVRSKIARVVYADPDIVVLRRIT
jgi:hypothetical protein